MQHGMVCNCTDIESGPFDKNRLCLRAFDCRMRVYVVMQQSAGEVQGKHYVSKAITIEASTDTGAD